MSLVFAGYVLLADSMDVNVEKEKKKILLFFTGKQIILFLRKLQLG